MAYSSQTHQSLLLVLLVSLSQSSVASRTLSSLVQNPSDLVTFHNGPLLHGDIPVTIFWYGKFTQTQKSILSDFLLSLTPTTYTPNLHLSPSVSNWWSTIENLYVGKSRILLTTQVSDETCYIGKSLKRADISKLATKAGTKKGGITLILTSEDVSVEGFCMSRCGSHGSNAKTGSAYIWVGNSATQCPGQCAWPFHQPLYGPQGPALVAPNGDVGVDGMVINLASMVAGAVTNPFRNGFYQGPNEAPLEAGTACSGVFGKGAYPGYTGELLVDKSTGASYNANGLNSRKFLLPAIYDPFTASCSTLV